MIRSRYWPPFAGNTARLAAQLALILLASVFATQPLELEAQENVSDVKLRPGSRSPHAPTGYEVEFTTPSALEALDDEIILTLHERIGVPSGIAASNVQIRHKGDTYGSVPASNVTIRKVDHGDRGAEIAITPSRQKDEPDVIPADAVVTVILQKAAGITNPGEGGSYAWTVHTSKNPAPVPANYPSDDVRKAFGRIYGKGNDAGLLVDRQVGLSREEAGRSDQVDVTTSGYRSGSTLTVWRDSNLDGQLDRGEVSLCQAEVSNTGIGKCSFDVQLPPFKLGYGICEETLANCNLVNAVDGNGLSSTIEGTGEARHVHQSLQVLDIGGKLSAEQEQSAGGDVRLELVDFPPGVVEAITVGGHKADFNKLSIGTSGRLWTRVPLPSTARLGRQALSVSVMRDDNGQMYSKETVVNITRLGTVVRMLPQVALPNQRIALTGKGFSATGDSAIEEIDIGGLSLEPARIAEGSGTIPIDKDGTWSGYINLPILQTTTVPGTHTLRVTDTGGKVGSVEFNIPPRELTVEPASATPGNLITVTGQGFPSRGPQGSGVVLRIFYDWGDSYTLTPAHTDINGKFSQEIRVPYGVHSPSTNKVRVEFDRDDGVTAQTVINHHVPGPTLTLVPQSGPPGTPVTLSGKGFRQFSPVQSIMMGGLSLPPREGVATDRNGEFSLDFQVPGVGVGRQNIRATVGGVLSTGHFEVSASGVLAGHLAPASSIEEAMGDRFLSVFHFNSDSKRWSFYDPEVKEMSNLQHMVAGETYLIQVRKSVRTVLNGKQRSLTCFQEVCWNQIVW